LRGKNGQGKSVETEIFAGKGASKIAFHKGRSQKKGGDATVRRNVHPHLFQKEGEIRTLRGKMGKNRGKG